MKKMLIYIYICSISHHHHPRSSFSHLNVIFDSPKHACECLEKRLKSCKTFIHSHIVEKSICVCECVYWSRLLYFAHFFSRWNWVERVYTQFERNMCKIVRRNGDIKCQALNEPFNENRTMSTWNASVVAFVVGDAEADAYNFMWHAKWD